MRRRIVPALAAMLTGAGVFALLRAHGARESDASSDPRQEPIDRVDEADLESFPASDPPPWTLGEES